MFEGFGIFNYHRKKRRKKKYVLECRVVEGSFMHEFMKGLRNWHKWSSYSTEDDRYIAYCTLKHTKEDHYEFRIPKGR